MKIGIYSPYLDTAGGGEKYILTIAQLLSEKEQVDFFLGTHLYSANIKGIKERIEKLHNLDLSKINFIKGPFGSGSSLLQRLLFLQNYDWFFYLTDGSIFLSTAKNSVIHFQVPFENTTPQNWWGKLKLNSWKLAIYNSEFTKQIVEKTWGLKGMVVYPPVSIEEFKAFKKNKYILSVGRFFGFLKTKKHEELIEAFRKLCETKKIDGWSLHLAGGVGSGDDKYLKELQSLASNLPIFFHPNISFKDLKKLYGESSIYWHATGFGEKDPKLYEHFGMTTVEAMAAGCVPVVINLGGQKEIVTQGESGFLWDSEDQLINYTTDLITNKEELAKMSKKALERSIIFTKENFNKAISKIVYGNN